MINQSIRNSLKNIIEIELKLNEKWDDSKSFLELGAQSIQMMKIQMGILETFGIKLTLRDLFENNTIDSLTNCLEKKINKE